MAKDFGQLLVRILELNFKCACSLFSSVDFRFRQLSALWPVHIVPTAVTAVITSCDVIAER